MGVHLDQAAGQSLHPNAAHDVLYDGHVVRDVDQYHVLSGGTRGAQHQANQPGGIQPITTRGKKPAQWETVEMLTAADTTALFDISEQGRTCSVLHA